MQLIHLSFISFLLVSISCTRHNNAEILEAVKTNIAKREAALNRIHNEINGIYGFSDGYPRVNLGPCGRFARDFHEQWNKLFDQKINIVFAMTPDRKECYHVLVKLPDGNYYDGGNGIVSGTVLYKQFANGLILDEMKTFSYDSLDKWSYSLKRNYARCPNYSDDSTLQIISRHLAGLVR